MAPNLPRKSVSVPRDDPHAARNRPRHGHDFRIEELRLVDGDQFGGRPDLTEDLRRRIDRCRLEFLAIVGGDSVEAGVAGVEMRLEHLHLAPGDDRAAHAPDELFALSTEHDTGNDLDPSGADRGTS
jgi:hypothetical protein